MAKTTAKTQVLTLAALKTVAANVVASLVKQGHAATIKQAKTRWGVNVKGYGLVAGFGPVGGKGNVQISCQFGPNGGPYQGFNLKTAPDWASYSQVKKRYNVLSGTATAAQCETAAIAALKNLPK